MVITRDHELRDSMLGSAIQERIPEFLKTIKYIRMLKSCIMKIKCDFCSATATGAVDQFIDLGWSRVVFYAPVRKTVTACKDHISEFNQAIINTLPERVRDRLIPDPIPANCYQCNYREKGFLSEPDECRYPGIPLFKFVPSTGRPAWCPLVKSPGKIKGAILRLGQKEKE